MKGFLKWMLLTVNLKHSYKKKEKLLKKNREKIIKSLKLVELSWKLRASQSRINFSHGFQETKSLLVIVLIQTQLLKWSANRKFKIATLQLSLNRTKVEVLLDRSQELIHRVQRSSSKQQMINTQMRLFTIQKKKNSNSQLKNNSLVYNREAKNLKSIVNPQKQQVDTTSTTSRLLSPTRVSKTKETTNQLTNKLKESFLKKTN